MCERERQQEKKIYRKGFNLRWHYQRKRERGRDKRDGEKERERMKQRKTERY